MSTQPVTLDMSKAQPIGQPAQAVTLDMSKAQPIAAQPSAWDAQQEQAHQTRMSALSGLTGMPTINMSPEDKQSFEQGKAAGAISVPVVAGATAAGASGMLPPAARALAPIAKKYGIRALEGIAGGVGLAPGYEVGRELWRELKKVYE